MADGQIQLGTVVRAVGRVCYTEALTVGWSSVLFVLASIPLFTIGASLLALVETWISIITAESRGEVISERERVRLFTDTWRANLVAGVPYSLSLLVIVAGSFVYRILGSTTGSALVLLWTLVSLYVVVIVLGWEFRAASIRMRSAESARPDFREAMGRAAYSLVEEPGYTVLHLAWFGGVLILSSIVPPAFVVLGPAVFAVSETVGFEELFGDGSEAVRAVYAR
ncbi:MAG TPA: hypothetical protein VFJ06_13740 [Halococcus sp.]|nr:hypothetical protein [Halococcus sp.]